MRVKALLLAVAVLIVLVLACGSDNTGEKVATSAPGATKAPPQLETYSIGDVIKVEDHTIVLNSVEMSVGRLKANFTIENNGSEAETVSSLMSFEAKNDEGERLEQDIFDCSPDLGGTVLPGDKLKGNICWEGTLTDKIRIYYEASLFGSGAVVWEVNK